MSVFQRHMFFSLCIGLIAMAVPSSVEAGTTAAKIPTALAWRSDGKLVVALRDSRQIIAFDPTSWTKADIRSLSFRPSSVVAFGDKASLLVGGMEGEIAFCEGDNNRMLRDSTGRGPTLLTAIDSERFAVSNRWERSIQVFRFAEGSVAETRTFPLTFSPGRIVKRSGERLLVLDAFGSKIADVNIRSGHTRTRLVEGVNLHAGALSGDGRELLVGHMGQYRAVPLTSTNIDWGLVISAGLSAIQVKEFDGEDSTEGTTVSRRKLTLDGSAHGASDPSSLAITPDGTIVFIALSGAHQVLKNDRTLGETSRGDAQGLLPLGHNQKLETLEVGRSPVDIVLDPKGEFAVTADSMSDTLTVVRTVDLSTVKTIVVGDLNDEPTQIQRGEAAFHDGRRSLDRWMTCASCHPGGHTNGLNFDTLGDGGYGAAKNTPSLLGVATTPPYSWIGRFPELVDQTHESLKTSLRGPTPDVATVEDLTAFLRTLHTPPPTAAIAGGSALRGARLFEDRKCGSCHEASNFTTDGVKGVGLDDGAGDHKAFNPPTLRGVGWSSPYFHDGRASSLDEVLKIHPPSRLKPLGEEDRADLRAFLETL